jgi:hypothetical protein
VVFRRYQRLRTTFAQMPHSYAVFLAMSGCDTAHCGVLPGDGAGP